MPPQSLTFKTFDKPLRELLSLRPPAGISPDVSFCQLDYIDAYLRDDEIQCSLVAIEEHYVDRDFMEDFSVFYSRSFSNIDNYCRRVHFFRGEADQVMDQFWKLAKSRRSLGSELLRRRSHRFSRQHYLGFSVIKPLSGTPIGRTALTPFPQIPGPGVTKGMTRSFHATRRYHAHLLGLELSVRGLAFQQQDVGVAACATTAIWTALQKNREKEELGITTPAHITTRATHNRMPFGRSMPSDGLSIDQMCQAVQSFGLSPVLTPAKDFIAIRATLYAALKSELSPVLVIKRTDPGHIDEYHAIAVVGMKLSESPQAIVQAAYSQASDHLVALFIHDDRFGPYLRAHISRGEGGTVALRIRTRKLARTLNGDTGEFSIANGSEDDPHENWEISHVLIPTHAKLRLSFPELHEMALGVMGAIDGPLRARQKLDVLDKRIEFWVSRSHSYVDLIASSESPYSTDQALELAASTALPRYVGVLRTHFVGQGVVDVVVDSTSTDKNPAFVAALCSADSNDLLRRVVSGLASQWQIRAY